MGALRPLLRDHLSHEAIGLSIEPVRVALLRFWGAGGLSLGLGVCLCARGRVWLLVGRLQCEQQVQHLDMHSSTSHLAFPSSHLLWFCQEVLCCPLTAPWSRGTVGLLSSVPGPGPALCGSGSGSEKRKPGCLPTGLPCAMVEAQASCGPGGSVQTWGFRRANVGFCSPLGRIRSLLSSPPVQRPWDGAKDRQHLG